MLKKYISGFIGLIILTVLVAPNAEAQELIFSRLDRNPLQLNPALTGHIEGNYRFVLMYRQQGLSVGSSPVYQTPSASADFNFGKGPHTWGAGLSLNNDKSAGGALNDLILLGGLAFHLNVDRKNNHFLSLGFQGGYRQVRIDPTQLGFADQFDGQQINLNFSSNEAFENTQLSTPEFRTGLTWSTYTEKVKWIIGGAYFNFLEPSIGFISESFRTAVIVGHTQLRIKTGKRMWLEPSAYYFQQSGIDFFQAGSMIAFKGKEGRSGFSAGMFYRNNDALIPAIEIFWKDWLLSFSFDQTMNELRDVNNGAGAFELSLRFQGKVLSKPDAVLPAIRFH